MALEKAQEAFHEEKYRHRAILVYDQNKKIVGKVSQMDVLRALEPRYKDLGESSMTRFGFSKTFLKSMMEHFRLWEKPLEEICKKAADLKVKDVMYTPSEGEYVREDASINEAIHQLVMGHHQSLLVTDADKRRDRGHLEADGRLHGGLAGHEGLQNLRDWEVQSIDWQRRRNVR